MGTSHRHTPTIQHQPNWGQTSASVTSIAIGVEKADELDKNPPAHMTPQQITKRQSTLDNQIRKNFHRAVRNLVRSAGGRAKVGNGTSRALGHAGVVVLGKFVSTFNEITNHGLVQWMRDRGILSLEGKTCRDILNIIRGFIQNGVAGLDNTAANEALEHVMELLEDQMDDNITSFDEVMGKVWEKESIKDLIDEFFGMYIFSHLSQDFTLFFAILSVVIIIFNFKTSIFAAKKTRPTCPAKLAVTLKTLKFSKNSRRQSLKNCVWSFFQNFLKI